MNFTVEQLEELRAYFSEKPLIVKTLPDIKTVRNLLRVYHEVGNSIKIYVAYNGTWKYEGDL